MASYADPDEATAALIAMMIAEDLDAEDAADSYNNSYPEIYDEDNNHHSDNYGDSGGSSYLPEPTSSTSGSDGTWDQYTGQEDPSWPAAAIPTIAEAPDGTWDSSQQAFPTKPKGKNKSAAAVDQQHNSNEPPPASTSTSSSTASITTQKPLDNTLPLSPQPRTSNAPGKRRADSPPAVRLSHRPHPSDRRYHHIYKPKSLKPLNFRPTTISSSSKNPNQDNNDNWCQPVAGSEDWDLMKLRVPWPGTGSDGGMRGRGAGEVEEGFRRAEEASVVEIRVGEGEDLWSLLGEMCLEEERGGE